MECPKCQFVNREEVKFCEECGTKMEFECPNCGTKVPMGRKFCGECGHNLGLPSEPIPKELSFDEKLEKIQRYLPKGLTEKILSQRDKIEGERKQVTVMFSDMEGFTPLSEMLGIEDAYAIMDQVYEILIHKVHDYEGTVNEMTGDGIMALFGAPVALEDAPQRAIRSSLAIHREMAKFSDQLRQEKRGVPPIKMRIGIHTGPVVVGTVGNDLRIEFKALSFFGTLYLRCRDFQKLHESSEELIEFATKHQFRRWLTMAEFRKGFASVMQDKGNRDIPQIIQAILNLKSSGSKMGATHFLMRLAEAYLKIGEIEEGLGILNEAESLMIETDERIWESELYHMRGDFLLMKSQENQSKSESCFTQALNVAKHQRAKSMELRAAMSLSRLWQNQGKKEEAKRLLSKIFGWFTEGFDTADLKDAKALLEELS